MKELPSHKNGVFYSKNAIFFDCEGVKVLKISLYARENVVQLNTFFHNKKHEFMYNKDMSNFTSHIHRA